MSCSFSSRCLDLFRKLSGLWFCRLSLFILRLFRFVLRSHLSLPILTDGKASYLLCSFSSWYLDLFRRLSGHQFCGLLLFILCLLHFVLRSYLWLFILDTGVNCFSYWVVLILIVCFIFQVSLLIYIWNPSAGLAHS